jgi:hypothetical protein
MEKKSRKLMKLVGAALVFLTLTSTAVLVVQSCHVKQEPVVAVAVATHASHGDHNHQHAPTPVEGLSSAAWLTKICGGIFFLVLILGSKFLLKPSYNSYREKVLAFRANLFPNISSKNFNLTLSLPQLGICRI